MPKNDWWFKFEIPAWRNSPELRRCSLATRGFWIDCIAIMRDLGEPVLTGSVIDIARMVGCFPDEAAQCIEELRTTKTADVSVTSCNADVTLCNAPVTDLYKNVTVNVTLTSRRLQRELTAKEKTNLRVQRHRDKKRVTPDVTPSVTDVKRTIVISNKKEVINNNLSSPVLSLNSATAGDADPASGLKKVQTPKPAERPAKTESEIETWLDAVASAVGAKDRNRLPNQRRWREVVEKAVSEDRSLADFLNAVRGELSRNRDTPQFFSADSVLKIVQLQSVVTNGNGPPGGKHDWQIAIERCGRCDATGIVFNGDVPVICDHK